MSFLNDDCFLGEDGGFSKVDHFNTLPNPLLDDNLLTGSSYYSPPRLSLQGNSSFPAKFSGSSDSSFYPFKLNESVDDSYFARFPSDDFSVPNHNNDNLLWNEKPSFYGKLPFSRFSLNTEESLSSFGSSVNSASSASLPCGLNFQSYTPLSSYPMNSCLSNVTEDTPFYASSSFGSNSLHFRNEGNNLFGTQNSIELRNSFNDYGSAEDTKHSSPAEFVCMNEITPLSTNIASSHPSGSSQLISPSPLSRQATLSSSCDSPKSLSDEHKGDQKPRRKKSCKKGANSPSSPSVNEDLDIEKIKSGNDTRCAVMLRNMPNRFTKDSLIRVLDTIVPKRYTILNMPLDPKTHRNLGYCFIQFHSIDDLIITYEALQDKTWPHSESQKRVRFCYAKIQVEAYSSNKQ